MEIVFIIGILAAFFAGAYIRQPFYPKDASQKVTFRKSADRAADPPYGSPNSGMQFGGSPPGASASDKEETEKKKREEERLHQLQNMLNYIGKGQNGED